MFAGRCSRRSLNSGGWMRTKLSPVVGWLTHRYDKKLVAAENKVCLCFSFLLCSWFYELIKWICSKRHHSGLHIVLKWNYLSILGKCDNFSNGDSIRNSRWEIIFFITENKRVTSNIRTFCSVSNRRRYFRVPFKDFFWNISCHFFSITLRNTFQM